MPRNFGHARREIDPDQQLERGDRNAITAIVSYVLISVILGIFAAIVSYVLISVIRGIFVL